MENLDWEVYVQFATVSPRYTDRNVIDAPEVNAFVLPGGKVFVFTGILKVAQNEAGLAAGTMERRSIVSLYRLLDPRDRIAPYLSIYTKS